MLIAFQLLQTIGYYGFMHWLPILLKAKGFEHNHVLTLQTIALLLAPIGPLLAMWSCERWQRQRLIVALALALAALQAAFGLATDALLLTLLGAVMALCFNWFSAIFHAYQAELYPTRVRALGTSTATAWLRLASILGPQVVGFVIAGGGLGNVFLVFGVAVLFAGITVALFATETKARVLEEISP